ncbi:MAG TPA: DUF624 domain-containing protein [Anaerolineales bacterium]|jgi:uncharacterized membrane protein YesL|nr:DUF624 domain-containing protein [Anaerolineales bacterium]
MDVTNKGLIAWFVEGFHNFFDILVANVLWALLTIPLITAPPAAAGLYYTTNQLAHDRPVTWRTFFEGFRLYFWVSWRWALLNLLVLAILFSNLVFYTEQEGDIFFWVRAIFIAMVIIWLLIQTYTFPLLIEQTEQRTFLALRNSVGLFAFDPKYALGVAISILLLAYLATIFVWPSWLLFTAGLGAYLANRTAGYIVREVLASQSKDA